MSDFLSHLAERALAGSAAVIPQFDSVLPRRPNEATAPVPGAEIFEAATAIPSKRETIDRTSRVESLWQPTPVAADAASSMPAPASPATIAPPDPPALPVAPLSRMPEKEQPEPVASPRNQKEVATETPPEVRRDEIPNPAVHETRVNEVIELIHRQQPAQSLPGRQLPLIRGVQSTTPPSLTNAYSGKRELPAPPSINVTIGRLEVRAQVSPEKARLKSRPLTPAMSLETYLRERSRGARR